MPVLRGTPKVRFNLQPVKEKDFSYIILFFHYKRRKKTVRFRFSTGEKINPKHWSKEASRVKNTRAVPDCIEINNRLNQLEQHVINIWKENREAPLHPEEMRDELIYRMGYAIRPEVLDNKIPTLFEFIASYVEQEKSKPNAVDGTWKKYLTIFNHLQDYAKDRRRDISYQDIDWRFREDFIQWSYAEPRSHGQNTVNKSLDTIRKFMREALRLRYHSNMIFEEKGYSLKRVKVKNKVRLTRAELQTLQEIDFSDNPRLERVRDLFIVGAYSGQRYSDWHKITRESLTTNEQGKKVVNVMTTKTRRHVVIPLLPELQKVLEKYDYQLPKLEIQNFNNYIKEVFEIALQDATFLRIYSEGGQTKSEIVKKWEKASSHAARRSFVSNFLLMGISPNLIRQITGHSTEKQMFEYADISPEENASQFLKEVQAKQSNDV